MLISIDKKEYILITTEYYGIRIDYDSSTTPILYAHALYTLDELKTLVRQFKKKTSNKSDPKTPNLEFIHIELFKEKHPVKITRNGVQKPFFKGKMIYASATSRTNINHINFMQRIREQLFEQIILSRVSFWEDKLNVMSNRITFRLLKSDVYQLNKHTRNITFNKSNMDLSNKDNDYFVFKALTNLSQNK